MPRASIHEMGPATVMYKNPNPVSIGIIPSLTPGQIILVERSDGGLALPGGYVDPLEDASTAITREVFEETGMVLDAAQWTLFHSAITQDNKLLLFSYYRQALAMPVGFVPNSEVVRLLSAPWNTPLRFPLHVEAVEQWMNGPESAWHLYPPIRRDTTKRFLPNLS